MVAAEITALSDRVEQSLAKRGPHVARVARVGQDPRDLPQGIRFTHVAFWIYTTIASGTVELRRGYRSYVLYERADDPNRSDLIEDGPVDLFAGAAELRAGVVIPGPRLQQKLLAALTGPAFAKLHNGQYSMVSNPENNLCQNCTEHSLNLLFTTLYGPDDMARIKANIAAHFAAQPVEVNPLKHALGPLFASGVAMADHGEHVRAATFSTLTAFMDRKGLSTDRLTVTASRIKPLH